MKLGEIKNVHYDIIIIYTYEYEMALCDIYTMMNMNELINKLVQ